MPDDAAVRLRHLDALWEVQGQGGNVGTDHPPFVQQEMEGLRGHGDNHVDLAMAVAQAHQLIQLGPVFGAGVARQVNAQHCRTPGSSHPATFYFKAWWRPGPDGSLGARQASSETSHFLSDLSVVW